VVKAAVAIFDHPATAAAVTAERAFLAALGGGCNVPLGAYARPEAEGLRLLAFVGRADGSALVRGDRTGSEPEALGRALAADLVARGARELMPH
jgi:hydroxymethylbilane synthase